MRAATSRCSRPRRALARERGAPHPAIHRRSRLAMLLVAISMVVSWACSNSNPSPQPHSISVGIIAPAVDAGVLLSAAGSAAQPQTCPVDNPVFCDGGCCATGQTCAADGGCAETTAPAGCTSDFPVGCSIDVSCSGGACVALDSSGNNRNFVIQAPAGFVPGKFGTGVSTNLETGCNGPWITLDAGGLPSGNDPMTLELWLRADGGGSGQTLIYGQGAEAAGRWLVQMSGGQIVWPIGSQYAGVVNDDAWHFVAVTWDDTEDQGAIYLDGVLKSNRLLGTTISTPADAGVVLGGNCDPFPGAIDEMRILSFAADAGQIAADFDAGRLSAIPGTVGLWHFDEGGAEGCCAAGATCDSNLGCVGVAVSSGGCPSSAPVDCGDGNCCAAGWNCANGACVLPSDAGTCPAGFPVNCDNGTCCQAGATCAGGVCSNVAPATPAPHCPGLMTVAVPQDPATGQPCPTCIVCCPPPAPGQLVTVGVSNGSFTDCEISATATTCPAGYTWSASMGSCIANAIIPQQCSIGSVGCTGTATSPGGCCTSGVCDGNGGCCPTGQSVCDGGCCAPAAGQSCNPTCPAGTVCSNGECEGPAAPVVCGNGTPCGDACCPNGESCINGTCRYPIVSIQCPENLPSQCGPAGPCCRANFTCFGNSGPGPSGFYCVGPSGAPHGGPQGPACGASDYCGSDDICNSSSFCCPADAPVACEDQCCGAGESCDAGHCACPAGESGCGAACCPAGSACQAGVCVPTCDNGDACNGFCCNSSSTCNDGACSCPDDYPVACGGACCLPGGSCVSTVDCSCPPDQPPCGFDCCAPGGTCFNGVCLAPGQSPCGGDEALMSCPDGSQLCCSGNQVCCHDLANNGAIGCEFQGFCE